ncbi:MAG TPA: hypothetical protein ENG42_03310 [Candidatus Aenigmarchaeota archaeon]|nr:MAG: hypothetical protein DRP03_00360 [Candidatus Aenigmarchaeota archaeon]HDD46480.1 hypothetical protein [Candidatus Aenigmarchaeota archaeon]
MNRAKYIMSFFIVITMLLSIVGFAIISVTPLQKRSGFSLPLVINRTLTQEERASVVRSGRTLIEYIFPASCYSCFEKRSMYVRFVNSPDYKGYVVLESVASDINESIDRMIGMYGNVYDLTNITTQEELEKLFCEAALIKPEICVLFEI